MSISLELSVLQKYAYNDVFVETGTFQGGAVALAGEAGFKDIRSVEVHKPFHDACAARFRDCPNIRLYFGDSIDMLWPMIEEVRTPITFWLDGHILFFPGAALGKKNIPILEELEIIGRHPIKTHTLMIDDRRVMGTAIWDGITEAQVIEEILRINPNYRISYEDSPIAPEDILIATIGDGSAP